MKIRTSEPKNLNKHGMALPLVISIVLVLLVLGAAFFTLISQRSHETVLSYAQAQADLIIEAAQEMTELQLRKAFERFDENERRTDTPLNRLYYYLLEPRQTESDGDMDVSGPIPVVLTAADLGMEEFIAAAGGEATISVQAELIKAKSFIDDSWKIPEINSETPNVSTELDEFYQNGKLPFFDLRLPTYNLAKLLNFKVMGVEIKLGNMLGLHKINISEEIISRIYGFFGKDIDFPLKIGLTFNPPLPPVTQYGWPAWGPAPPGGMSVNEDVQIEKAGRIKFTIDVEYTPSAGDVTVNRQMIMEKDFRMPDRQAPAPMYSLFMNNSGDEKINLNSGGNFYVNSWPLQGLLDNLESYIGGQLERDAELPGSIRYNGTQPTIVYPSLLAFTYNADGSANLNFNWNTFKGCNLLLGMHPNWLPSGEDFKLHAYSVLKPFALIKAIKSIVQIVTAVIVKGEFKADFLWQYSEEHTWLMFWMPYVQPQTIGDLIYSFCDGHGVVAELLGSAMKEFFEAVTKYGPVPGEPGEYKYTMYGIPTLGMKKATTHLFGDFAMSPPMNRACEGLVEKRTYTYFNHLGYVHAVIIIPVIISFSQMEQGKFTYPSYTTVPHYSNIQGGDWEKMFLAANNDPMVTHDPSDVANRPRYMYSPEQYSAKSGDFLDSQAALDDWIELNTDGSGAVVFDRWIEVRDDSGIVQIGNITYKGIGGIYSDVNIEITGDITAAEPGIDKLTIVSWHETGGSLVCNQAGETTIYASVVAKDGILNANSSKLTIHGNLVVDRIVKTDPASGAVKMGGRVRVKYFSPGVRCSIFSIKRVEGKYDPARYSINFAPVAQTVSYQTL